MGQGSGVAMRCGVGCKDGSDPALLWLWRRPVATAPIRPLGWGPPYAVSGTLKKKRQKKNSSGVPVVVQWLMNPTRNHGVVGSIPGLAQWVKDLVFLCTVVKCVDFIYTPI